MVAPAGTTFGVADPTSRNVPLVPLGHEQRRGLGAPLSTVTVQDRAFGGTGPTAGGSSGAGVGVGVGLGVGLGEAGGEYDGDTPTIWIDSTICRTSDLTVSLVR